MMRNLLVIECDRSLILSVSCDRNDEKFIGDECDRSLILWVNCDRDDEKFIGDLCDRSFVLIGEGRSRYNLNVDCRTRN